ncbi:potassium-transporting ATPase subunit C [Isosphaeraceae bacterium EP7]
MIREILNALMACVVTFALCAVAYPAAVYAIGHTLFPAQAEGSLIVRDGKVVGSSLIAQPFASNKYFRPRPSAAGATGYAADAASGSNLATTNPALRDRIALEAARQIGHKSGDATLKGHLSRLDALQSDPTREEAAQVLAKILERSAELGKADGVSVPVDLVTASGAGLDPDISIEAARYQAPRVAAARGLSVERILHRIEARGDRSGAIFGAPPRLNVLLLNLDLDELAATSPPHP